jgi:hypothetical protein
MDNLSSAEPSVERMAAGHAGLQVRKPGIRRHRSPVRWASIIRASALPLTLAALLTGCHTAIQAPGAVGKVVDADTGTAVQGASITRPAVTGLWGFKWIPSERLPAVSVRSDQRGQFDLPPATLTRIAHMYFENPPEISGSFTVSAEGYTTNELRGLATPRTGWRVNLGRVLLKKP